MPTPPEVSRAAWRALVDLLAGGQGVHLTAVAEADGPTRLHGTTTRGRAASGTDLADLLLELAGRPRLKTCARCPAGRRERPVSHFAHNAGREDGRSRYCRECECRRLRKYKRPRAAGPAAAGPSG